MTLRREGLTLRLYDGALKLMAVDRLVQLVVDDEITRPVREWVDKKWPESKISYLVNCKACVSVWAGLAVSVGKMPHWVISALAASDAVLLIDRNDERLGALVAAYRKRS